MPPKHQRRSHTKSKKGCSQCKIRRIKCNEIGPKCNNCERRQIECDFELSPEKRPAASSNIGTARSASNSDRASHTPPVPAPNGNPSTSEFNPFTLPNLVTTKKTTDLDVDDLQLMHHFSTVLAYDLANQQTGEALALWQTHAVNLGFKHDFLLRGLLAVSALHQSYLYPHLKVEFDLRASTHQSIAIHSFQETLGNVNETNCHALFAFSCIIIVLSFASSSKDKASDFQTDVLHWLYLLRGCNEVLKLYREILRNSFLKPLLDELHYAENHTAHNIEDIDRITDLFSLCSTTNLNDDKERSQACTLAIHALLSTFVQASILRSRGEGTVLASFVWSVNLPPKFLEMLSEKQPEALVILAHYCVLIYWGEIQDTWFLVGWARYMLDTIKELTPEEWHEHLRWPDGIIK